MKLKKLPVRQALDFKFEDKEGENREVISVRLPKTLLKELDSLTERSGYKKKRANSVCNRSSLSGDERSKVTTSFQKDLAA